MLLHQYLENHVQVSMKTLSIDISLPPTLVSHNHHYKEFSLNMSCEHKWLHTGKVNTCSNVNPHNKQTRVFVWNHQQLDYNTNKMLAVLSLHTTTHSPLRWASPVMLSMHKTLSSLLGNTQLSRGHFWLTSQGCLVRPGASCGAENGNDDETTQERRLTHIITAPNILFQYFNEGFSFHYFHSVMYTHTETVPSRC